jgi:hypothetical protein
MRASRSSICYQVLFELALSLALNLPTHDEACEEGGRFAEDGRLVEGGRFEEDGRMDENRRFVEDGRFEDVRGEGCAAVGFRKELNS